MNVTLLHSCDSSPAVTFHANLRRDSPTGYVLVGQDTFTLEQARDLARRLAHSCERLDVLIAANTRQAA